MNNLMEERIFLKLPGHADIKAVLNLICFMRLTFVFCFSAGAVEVRKAVVRDCVNVLM